MTGALFALTFVAALGSALTAGLFFIFSICIMRALGRITPAAGIAAMQSINRVILNPLFFAAFFGTALLSVVLIVWCGVQWETRGTAWAMAGGVVYLITSIGVTMAANVPLNTALDQVRSDSADGMTFWARYQRVWTAWNHVRSAGTLLATAFFILALA